MISIVKSPRYERDIEDIWDHIAQDNVDAADRVVTAMECRIELLGQFPGLGTPCYHLAPGLRRLQWRAYLIYYRQTKDRVEIVRALHGRRNIASKLFDGTTTGEAWERAMQGLYLEEFEVGRKFEHGLRRTVTEMDNTLFSCLTHNPQPLHIDHDFAAKSEWGKPLVNSLFTMGVMIGVSVGDTTIGTTVGNLGMTDVRFPKPVFHGDTLNFTTEVLSRRESRSRSDVGIVEFLHRAYNQRGELVAECKRQAMMHKRPKA